jgi:hypothetical protein
LVKENEQANAMEAITRNRRPYVQTIIREEGANLLKDAKLGNL